MPFSHNGLKTTSDIQVFSQVNKYTLSYRFLYGNVHGCVFAKNRPVSLKVVWDPCQKITLLLLKSKSVRVIVPESCFKKRILIFLDGRYYSPLTTL